MMGRLGRAMATEGGIATSFLRKGWAARIGIGKEANFIDLIVLRAADDTNSVKNFQAYGLSPAKNMVLGIAVNQRFLKKFTFTADAAYSFYTGDVTATALDPTDTGIPPVIFNQVSPNFSSQGVMALSSFLGYTTKGFGVRIGYQRIDPGFASMGIYTTNNDLEIISLAPRLTVLRNRMTINANIRRQRDNLLGLKQKTTVRLLPSGTVAFNPTAKFGVSANITFSSINQAQGILQTTQLDRNKLVAQTNYAVMLSPHLSFGAENTPQSVMITLGTNRLADKGSDTLRRKYSEYSGLNGSINYSFGLEKQALTVNLGGNYFSLTTFEEQSGRPATTDNYGFNTGVDKGFLKNKLSTGVSAGYTLGVGGNNALSLSANASYRVDKHHSMRFNAYQAKSKYQDSQTRNFNEFRGTLDYTYTF